MRSMVEEAAQTPSPVPPPSIAFGATFPRYRRGRSPDCYFPA